MNCLDVCRQLAIDPNHLDEEMVRHVQHCQQCARVAAQQRGLNKLVEQSCQVEVPAGLEDKILLRLTIEQQNDRRFVTRHWLSVAAGLVLIVVSGIVGTLRSPSLETAVLGHIHNEENHLKETRITRPRKLATMLAAIDLKLKQSPQGLTYAGTCEIRYQVGAHFVVRGVRGRVTVLAMPGEYVRQAKRVGDKRFHGVIFPTSYGSMAVVGEAGEDLDRVRRQFEPLLEVKPVP